MGRSNKKQATVGETFAYAFECGGHIKLLFVIGSIAGILNGLTYPALAYIFSNSFSDVAVAGTDGLSGVRQLAHQFMILGVYALVVGIVQTWSFEVLAYHAAKRFRLEWFQALLRQDPSFFDVFDIGGVAGQVGPSSSKYRRGIGRKFGEGIQWSTTGFFGLLYAFYASWRTALVVLSVLPLASVAAMSVMRLNQTKSSRAAAAYETAGGVAYSAVSAIKTVISLNGTKEMIDRYADATQKAYKSATSVLIKLGLANGSMLGSFLLLYLFLTLYGSSLLYRDIRNTGCDPSKAIPNNNSCESTGPDVFGAMLGVAFAAQGASQFGNFSEAFGQARAAVSDALKAINRKPGTPEETIYRQHEEDNKGSTSHTRKTTNQSEITDVIKGILPMYEIDSSSDTGLKPKDIRGNISFKNVHFEYPTRPNEPVLTNLSVNIQPGQTVAFVGPSGSGKSTVVGLLERFYDPKLGCIELDGINLKDINVSHLRSMIGYVGQEPVLFATSIRGNILYGNPNATQEQIEEAARMANAHDFITSFPDGYDTQVGDKGSQLSGGQKQRIAICRCLIGSPKMLILDEATSALDSESEMVVQEALDNIVKNKKMTTIIIAHRLSTIRNADRINVLVDGNIKESGTHDDLMAIEEGYYRKLVSKQEGKVVAIANPSLQNSIADNNSLTMCNKTQSSENKYDTESGLIHMEFKDVTFRYPTRPNKIIFQGFSLKIRKGQTVALCGPSGGGKSTVVGLIERFYDPEAGSVEYLGNDITRLNVRWYRDQIGYVGQEPTLFNDTIANNISFGIKGVSRDDIIEAAKQANAYDFIMSFEHQFDTPVGERGTQLSGGQKQRVAIARALIRKPQILLLDEATSAIDNESEAIVQATIDKLINSVDQTVIVIAHRLSTIRNADKICFIADGKVLESGSHDELMNNDIGRYKRLFDSSKRNCVIEPMQLIPTDIKQFKEDTYEEEFQCDEKVDEEEKQKFDPRRARKLALPDLHYIVIGTIGAVIAGGVYPMWGLLFSEMISLLFQPVSVCPDSKDSVPENYTSCQDYWDGVADSMKNKSFRVAGFWAVAIFGCFLGNFLTYWGFGTASERLNKRVRDLLFSTLIRQEVSFFDKRSVGNITSILQDDSSRIHAFLGDPVRSISIALASVATGIALSFIFMWPFALMAIGCIPIMGVASSNRLKLFLGEDKSEDNDKVSGLNTPSGVLFETLLNMRTVSSLTIENARCTAYEEALLRAEPNYKFEAFKIGLIAGSAMFLQQWIYALQFWFGGWLLYNFPDDYELRDFLISNFAIVFSLAGAASAFQDMTDRKEVENSASRVFYLLDRKSAIDPLSEDGTLFI